MTPVDVVPRISAGRLVIGIWIAQSWPQQDYETTILLSPHSKCDSSDVLLFTANSYKPIFGRFLYFMTTWLLNYLVKASAEKLNWLMCSLLHYLAGSAKLKNDTPHLFRDKIQFRWNVHMETQSWMDQYWVLELATKICHLPSMRHLQINWLGNCQLHIV